MVAIWMAETIHYITAGYKVIFDIYMNEIEAYLKLRVIKEK